MLQHSAMVAAFNTLTLPWLTHSITHHLYATRLSLPYTQHAEYSFLSSLNVLNVVQSGIMFAGISTGMLACTAGVARVCLSLLLLLLLLWLLCLPGQPPVMLTVCAAAMQVSFLTNHREPTLPSSTHL